ncbi:MAG: LysM peptidoglycan-binding domain-containing protein, partial [Akkermansiaceae bacterium]|nr:LysM peptidoglycan-binding domain-containing protein [Akkermansiaceae bacterium]
MRELGLPAIAATFLTALLAGCGSSDISATSYNPGYGPFDENGNYVEAWADKPAKKHWWSRKPATPEAAGPAPASGTKPVLLAGNSPRSRSREVETRPQASRGGPMASLNRAAPVNRPPAPKPASPPSSSPPSSSRPPTTTPPSTSPPPVSPTPSSRPKPKPLPVKVSPGKPATIRHTVRKGDTLYSLSRRYGTSVGAIQKANGI